MEGGRKISGRVTPPPPPTRNLCTPLNYQTPGPSIMEESSRRPLMHFQCTQVFFMPAHPLCPKKDAAGLNSQVSLFSQMSFTNFISWSVGIRSPAQNGPTPQATAEQSCTTLIIRMHPPSQTALNLFCSGAWLWKSLVRRGPSVLTGLVHVPVSVLVPGQLLFEHNRVRLRVPGPQLLEHAPHLPHAPQLP